MLLQGVHHALSQKVVPYASAGEVFVQWTLDALRVLVAVTTYALKSEGLIHQYREMKVESKRRLTDVTIKSIGDKAVVQYLFFFFFFFAEVGVGGWGGGN